jgi:transcriptional regulator with XRE-family HTH domain
MEIFIGSDCLFQMPRKNPMLKQEADICVRLREFRRATGLSRVAFSKRAGVELTTLANYEHGRTPVRYEHFRWIAQSFDLSPAWLATGKGEALSGTPWLPPGEGRSLFSSIYKSQLRSKQRDWEKSASDDFSRVMAQLKGFESAFKKLTPKQQRSKFWQSKLPRFSQQLEQLASKIRAFAKRKRSIRARLAAPLRRRRQR